MSRCLELRCPGGLQREVPEKDPKEVLPSLFLVFAERKGHSGVFCQTTIVTKTNTGRKKSLKE